MQASQVIDTPTQSRRTLAPALLEAGRMVVVVSLLALSPLALYRFGWQYFDTGGSPLEKFHPATLLLVALVGVMATTRHRNPVAGLFDLLMGHRILLPFLAACVFMMGYAALILKLPFTMFVETYIGAALLVIVFDGIEEEEAHRLALIIHALLFANALLGFAESLGGFKLTPLVVNGEELTDEPRSTALLGHPLSNAMLMGAYVTMLATGGLRDLPSALKPVVFLVSLASLVPFGGRAASVVTVLSLGYVAMTKFFAIARGGHFSITSVLGVLIAVPVAGLVLLIANELGALDTLTRRFAEDSGSAGTRVEMFALFQYLSETDILFGPDPVVLNTFVRLHGLEYGIESFPIAFQLNYGLLCGLIFFPCLALFLGAVVWRARPGAWLVLVNFLAVALTSISLSSKSPGLTIFVLLMVLLLRPGPAECASSGELGEHAP